MNKVILEQWQGFVLEMGEDGSTFWARIYKDPDNLDEMIEAEIYTSHLPESELQYVQVGARFVWTFYGDEQHATSEIVFDKSIFSQEEWDEAVRAASKVVWETLQLRIYAQPDRTTIDGRGATEDDSTPDEKGN